MKNILFCFLLFITIMITGCSQKNDTTTVYTYDEYISKFNMLNKQLSFDGFVNLGGNEENQIVYIDKKTSFDTRNYLTLDNEQSNLSTQQRIEYYNAQDNLLLVINLIYLDRALTKDLVFWDYPLLGNEINGEIRNEFLENILSYNNILINIKIFSVGDFELQANVLTDITSEVVDKLDGNSN